MFDYQAGEKYKLTLITTAIAGMVIGAFFTLLLSSPGEQPHKQARGSRRHANFEGGYEGKPGGSLRATGFGGRGVGEPGAQPDPAAANAASTNPANIVDKGAAQSLVQGFLQYTWDFNSNSANQSQQQAMSYMTPDCAQNYKVNVWTPQIADGVAQAAMTSTFTPTRCEAITSNDDGSVVVKVEGEQQLTLPGQPPRPKHVIMEYLVTKTPSGLKVSGISESGDFGT